MAERLNPGGYLKMIRTNVPILASRIQELAKAEIGPTLRRGGFGALFAVIALVVLFVMLLLLLLTGGFLFSMLYANWFEMPTAFAAGFGTMTVLCLVIVAIFVFLAVSQFKHVKAPEATIAETKASICAIVDAVEAGALDVKNNTTPVPARVEPTE